jgi:predicted ester cyclase
MSNIDVLRRAFEAYETNALDRLADCYTANAECSFPGGMNPRGVGQIKEIWGVFLEAFPDGKHEITSSFESGGHLAVELVFRGTHTGVLRSPTGNVPPTGKKIALSACDYVRVEGERMVSHHIYFDNLAFLGQLGLVPGAG